MEQLLEYQGYPIELFYAIAIIGLILIFYRPRWAFFFLVFFFASHHYLMSIFTRSEFLGEFLNLNDLLLWIGFLAMLRVVWQSSKLWIPNIIVAIIAIIVVGALQVLYLYGFRYLVMRDIWATCIFPIMFIVGANMVRTQKDARIFYWTIFIGSCAAVIHHLLFIQMVLLPNEILSGIAEIRTVDFMYSGGIFLVISALFINMRKILQKNILFILWAIGISLILVSYLLSFTRTIWAGGSLAAISLLVLLYREDRKILSRIGYAIPPLLITFLLFYFLSHSLLPGEVTQMIDERADFVRYQETFESAYETRESGIDTEIKLWLDGSIIWGMGSTYPPVIGEAVKESYDATGAINHVAFSSYLAHYGLIGLGIYGILLPFLAIRRSRRCYARHKYDYAGIIAVTAMGLAFFDLYTLVSGFHYLVPFGHMQALIYGALWSLSASLEVPVAKTAANRIMIDKPQQQWLPGTASS